MSGKLIFSSMRSYFDVFDVITRNFEVVSRNLISFSSLSLISAQAANAIIIDFDSITQLDCLSVDIVWPFDYLCNSLPEGLFSCSHQWFQRIFSHVSSSIAHSAQLQSWWPWGGIDQDDVQCFVALPPSLLRYPSVSWRSEKWR